MITGCNNNTVPRENSQAKIDALHSFQQIEIPEHFADSDSKQPGDFDVNTYFSVFKHVKMVSGYTLDYYYFGKKYSDGINVYPNPAVNSTRVNYELPKGANEGEIIFYNLQGNEVKRFKVDRTFESLLISTSDLAAGTYYYRLQTAAQSSEGKKMIVIK